MTQSHCNETKPSAGALSERFPTFATLARVRSRLVTSNPQVKCSSLINGCGRLPVRGGIERVAAKLTFASGDFICLSLLLLSPLGTVLGFSPTNHEPRALNRCTCFASFQFPSFVPPCRVTNSQHKPIFFDSSKTDRAPGSRFQTNSPTSLEHAVLS